MNPLPILLVLSIFSAGCVNVSKPSDSEEINFEGNGVFSSAGVCSPACSGAFASYLGAFDIDESAEGFLTFTWEAVTPATEEVEIWIQGKNGRVVDRLTDSSPLGFYLDLEPDSYTLNAEGRNIATFAVTQEVRWQAEFKTAS